MRFKIDTDRVKVDAAVEYVGKTPEGAMDVPKKWEDVAWYQLGPPPGEDGNSVIAGHLDSETGPAVFWNLKELKVGDEISIVTTQGKTTRFRVRKMQTYFDENAPLYDIFGPSDSSHLNLITCEGTFDPAAKKYNQKLVVFADKITG